jgi:hypothetical protein
MEAGLADWTWCELCDTDSPMVTLDEAARLSGCDSRTVFRQVEAGQVHFTETADGRLYICFASLTAG